MSIIHTITKSYGTPEGEISGTVSLTGAAEYNIDCAIAPSTTDQLINISPITRSRLKSIAIWAYAAPGQAACTLKTNASSVPQDNISLADGVPIVWSFDYDGWTACPFIGDVTSLYVTNADAVHSLEFKLTLLFSV